ncbi:unnamed protein product, partial [Pocillopora meandrina]
MCPRLTVVFLLVLVAVSMFPQTYAFTAGAGNIEPQSRIGLRYDNSVLTTPAYLSKMISKVRVFFLLVLIAVSMYPRTLAFTAGAGNIRGKRGANNIQV